MNREEFLKLEQKSKLDYLNNELTSGKTFEQICAELEMDKGSLGKQGFYYVKGKFLMKPVKGYQTAKSDSLINNIKL